MKDENKILTGFFAFCLVLIVVLFAVGSSQKEAREDRRRRALQASGSDRVQFVIPASDVREARIPSSVRVTWAGETDLILEGPADEILKAIGG